jgi:hypothetical protein
MGHQRVAADLQRLRAYFENISGGLAAGGAAGFVADWLHTVWICAFVELEQIRAARLRGLRRRPARRARNPFPIYFQNTF